MKLEFFGKNVLLIGGSCELAIELAKKIIAEGLCPILTYRSKEKNNTIINLLEAFSGRYKTIFLDLNENKSIKVFLKSLGSAIHYLVDFAENNFESLIASSNSNDVRCFFDRSIGSRTELLKEISRSMLKNRHGRLIYISSTAALRPNPGQGFYSAAKLANEAIYKNLGIELGGKGVTSLIIRPGYIDAGRGKKYLKSNNEVLTRNIPIKRALNAGEISDTILFFLSNSSLGFNAVDIVMDGGMTSVKNLC